MILELGISELNALILLLDDQGAGAISAEDGLGQNVSGRISQAVLLAASQLDDLVSLEVAGQRGVAHLLDPTRILHEVAGVNGMGVTNLGIAQEQGLIAESYLLPTQSRVISGASYYLTSMATSLSSDSGRCPQVIWITIFRISWIASLAHRLLPQAPQTEASQ